MLCLLSSLSPARTLVVSFAAVAPAYRPVTIDRFSKCNAASTTTRTTTATITGRTSGNSNDDNNNNNSKCNNNNDELQSKAFSNNKDHHRRPKERLLAVSQYTFPFQFQFQKYPSPSAVNKNQVKSSHGGTSKIKLQVASSTNCWPGRPTGFPPSTPQLEC